MSASPIADAFQPHDHRRCSRRARDAVAAECAARKLRLTPPRALVLEALLESHRAMTAYELLDRLRAAGLGSQPPVVYRALEFLLTHGFVHRIERLSAFVACTHGADDHAAAFLVCRACRTVAEASLPDLEEALVRAARGHDFKLERAVIEAEGLCGKCREAGA
jgi:Fur family zinc uptake transcriptional regulator